MSYVELNRPTGKHISRLALRELNLLMRKHAVVMIGNTCAPGLFFPEKEEDMTGLQFAGAGHEPYTVCVANPSGTEQIYKNGVSFEAEPFMYLHIKPEWIHFDDYVAAMTSKYRQRVKKTFRDSSELEITETHPEQMPAALFDSCTSMLRSTLKQKTVLLNRDMGGIIKRFGEHYGHNFRMKVLSHHTKPVGFISYSISGSEIHAWHLGYLPEYAQNHQVYLRLMFELVKTGIESSIRTLHLGRTATEIKSTLGAVPYENHIVIFTSSRKLKWLLGLYKRHFYRPKSYILRSPFRVKT